MGTTSTPIRPRRRSRRSRTRCGKCADRTPTLSLEVLLHRLNRVLRGWTAYFRFGVSHATFRYLRHFVWQRVIKWLRRKFRRSTWKELRRRYCGGRWWPVTDEVRLFDPARVKTVRYLYRGMKIPSPWPSTG
ncbi:group II intron maturase-specific domain-containing protein [Streptomyces mirabilis]|uniref:group II intron maturase-specific domain-containing protein n=1 Tax=Streptomyces mirabilis TaxID=68239 RepID=UPI0036C059C3